MSETEKDDQTPDAVIPDASFDEPLPAEPPLEAPLKPPPEVATKPKRGAIASVAWLALFLGLLSVAGVGNLYFEKMRTGDIADQSADAVAALRSRLDSTSGTIAELDTSIAALEATDAETRTSIESLGQALEDRTDLFDSLPPRMTSLERSVASLQGVSVDTRNTYLIAESEYYLQIANAQLQLAGNPYLASLALGQADDRLLQLADPALTDVRRAISDEQAALEVMEKTDIAGVTLTLASLARVVEALPIRQPSTMTDDSVDESEEEAGGIARAWGAVTGAVSGLVKHTPPSDEQAPLLTPDAEPLIRSNLSLQLQAARLALLRGEQEIFEQSLDDADVWLELYFDSGSEQVASTRQTLVEIRGEYSVATPPDISRSLRLLRQYKALTETPADPAQ